MTELYAMQRIEPTGQFRLECYLARLIAAVKAPWSKVPIDWRDELIGFTEQEQTIEQAFSAFERISASVKNGSNHESGR